MNSKWFLLIACTLLFLSPDKLIGQGIAVQQWRDHLPFSHLISLARSADKVYAASYYGIFVYDTEDNSISKLTKINGLTDIGISKISYSTINDLLLIAYQNANLDIVTGSKIINMPDIKNKNISGDKTIYNIYFRDRFAYLCCGFGVVVIDLVKQEVSDTWYIGNNGSATKVYDLTFDANGQTIYAATETGLRKALVSANPTLFSSWTQVAPISNNSTVFNLVVTVNDKILTNRKGAQYNQDTLYLFDNNRWSVFMKDVYLPRFSLDANNGRIAVNMNFAANIMNVDGSVYSQILNYKPTAMQALDMILDPDGTAWIADASSALIKVSPQGAITKIEPNGPSQASTFAIATTGKDVWAVAGGFNNSYGNNYLMANAFSFINGNWNAYNNQNQSLLGDARDYDAIAIDPKNAKHLYIGSWGWGISEYLDGTLKTQYTATNSSLRSTPFSVDQSIRIGGLAFDSKGNLWATNSITPNLLSVKKTDGTWRSFDLSPYNSIDVEKIIVDQNDQKWIILREHSIIVFNDNNTIDNTTDDKLTKLTEVTGNGNLPGTKIYTIVADKDGAIWIGSDKGVSVIYNPGNVFTGSHYDAQIVRIENNGQLIPLLENESVTAIAIDGANRKWMGTANSGLFLISADGTKELLHFTADNSPLLSNTISCIGVNTDGEVFIGTDKGLISYRSTASEPTENNKGVFAFPNPVRPSYTGVISIKGLTFNADVRITDVSGHLVSQMNADGGQATWDGKDLKGRRIAPGVYLVFVSNDDGTSTAVTKILIIR